MQWNLPSRSRPHHRRILRGKVQRGLEIPRTRAVRMHLQNSSLQQTAQTAKMRLQQWLRSVACHTLLLANSLSWCESGVWALLPGESVFNCCVPVCRRVVVVQWCRRKLLSQLLPKSLGAGRARTRTQPPRKHPADPSEHLPPFRLTHSASNQLERCRCSAGVQTSAVAEQQ